ncbi:Hypothetical predicted protein [Olea europaea subsp. europaea]|uniref:Uncharacterized protein n=1 Tax=Olea europaea subsp. europaea TaxID=158383 RepID=A0A8S0TJ52_OLEEU|nr:Hypothetical predicted protein [Olea europaea subsp. europaea]
MGVLPNISAKLINTLHFNHHHKLQNRPDNELNELTIFYPDNEQRPKLSRTKGTVKVRCLRVYDGEAVENRGNYAVKKRWTGLGKNRLIFMKQFVGAHNETILSSFPSQYTMVERWKIWRIWVGRALSRSHGHIWGKIN